MKPYLILAILGYVYLMAPPEPMWFPRVAGFCFLMLLIYLVVF